MRVPVILLALAVSAPAASAGPASAAAVERPNPLKVSTCRRPTSHPAEQGPMHRGKRIAPKKLTELPPAVAYMAVYRTVNGCEVPMTVVEYRTGRRP